MPLHPYEDGSNNPGFGNSGAGQRIPYACLLCPVTYPGTGAIADGERNSMPDAVERRKGMLSMLSHDIRTPLMIISANAEVLAETGTGMAAEQLSSIEQIKNAAHNASALIEEFLAILRLESGEIVLEPVPTPLSSVLALSLDSLEYLIACSSATICTGIPEDLPDVMVDADRFGRVITNIVTNALNHCQRGVNVRIAARRDGPSGGNVLLEFSDDGPGIDQDDLEGIFECGSGRKAKARTKGHGLGLMVVKTITELHGGTVGITRDASGGTTVRLTLPAAPDVSDGSNDPPTR